MAVVGGGVSGLAAAYRLRENAAVTLFEASNRAGGVLVTRREGGYLLEGGPDAFLDKGGIAALCADLGLADQLIRTNPEHRRSFIVRGRRLLPIPDGLYLMAPGKLAPFLTSPIVSPLGKARMLLDLLLPASTLSCRGGRGQGEGPHCADETLASFVRRRLGKEALDRLAQPLIGGIYTADPEQLGLAATQPQFLEWERTYRSIILALMRRRRQTGAVSGARYAQFLTFRDGMQTLVDALAARLPNVRLGMRVAALQHDQSHWTLTFEDGSPQSFDAVILALPLPEVARLLPNFPVPLTRYSSAATINVGFRRAQVRHSLGGAGFVVPHVEGRSIVAATFSSEKFEGRSPADRVLLRAFVGGMLRPDALSRDDATMVKAALADIADLLGVEGEPDVVQVNRWPESMPQYEVNHLPAVARLKQAVAALPGLALAGNGYAGVGVPDCIASGFAAADSLMGVISAA